MSPNNKSNRILHSTSTIISAGLNQLVEEHASGVCGDILQAHLNTGGKRIRAKLVLQLGEVFNIELQDAFQWALAVELLHNATLIHDDVQDGDMIRRNQPTNWATYGVPQAINAGDLGLTLPYQCIEKMNVTDGVRWRLSQTLSTHSIKTVCGQSLEMTLLSNRDFSCSSYTEAALGKTGSFFSLPFEGIAHIAGIEKDHRERLVQLFAQVGLLFQMQDDILDCFGNKGRNRGADICEGKVSFLVVEHLLLYPEEESQYVSILEKTDPTDEATIQRCIESFAERGALNMALKEITLVEQQLCNAPILLEYPLVGVMLNNLLDQILEPIQHLFESPLEISL